MSELEKDEVVFEILVSDVQGYAKKHLGRALTEEELDIAREGIDEALSIAAWSVFPAALQNATDQRQ